MAATDTATAQRACLGEGLFVPLVDPTAGSCPDCSAIVGGQIHNGRWIVLAAHPA